MLSGEDDDVASDEARSGTHKESDGDLSDRAEPVLVFVLYNSDRGRRRRNEIGHDWRGDAVVESALDVEHTADANR